MSLRNCFKKPIIGGISEGATAKPYSIGSEPYLSPSSGTITHLVRQSKDHRDGKPLLR